MLAPLDRTAIGASALGGLAIRSSVVLLGDAVDDGITLTNPALQTGRRRRKRADSLTQMERLKKIQRPAGEDAPAPLPRPQRSAGRPMSAAQLATFLSVARWPEDRRLHPLFLTLARGLRPGEAFGLQWEDVDLVERTLRIERSYSRGKLDMTKTGESRPVDMSRELARTLRRLEVERSEEKLRRG